MINRAVIGGMLLVLSCPIVAKDYYVSPGGKDSNPGTLSQPWGTIGKANSLVRAGDTVILRGGTYSGQSIRPAQSGSASAPITYRAYSGETPTLSGGSTQIDLNGRQYIIVDGVRGLDASNLWIDVHGGTSHCSIMNSTFRNAKGWNGVRIDSSSHHISFLNNSFVAAAGGKWGFGPPDTIGVSGSYILLEGNTLTYAGHYLINARNGAHHLIIKNNVLRNPHHAILDLYHAPDVIIEGNKFLDAGDDWNDSAWVDPSTGRSWPREKHDAIQHGGGSSRTIVRRNEFVNNGMILLADYADSGNAANVDNRYYNNTYYHNYRAAELWAYGPGTSAVWKNNIFAETVESNFRGSTGGRAGSLVMRNNFSGSSAGSADGVAISGSLSKHPGFVDAANRDFRLAPTSSMIDVGAHLTTVTSTSGSGTTFKVEDGRYFTSGWGLVDGDEIVVGTTKARIIAVDGNTLTVDRSINWENGAHVNLSFNGSGPDLGAYESGRSPSGTAASGSGSGLPVVPSGLTLSEQ